MKALKLLVVIIFSFVAATAQTDTTVKPYTVIAYNTDPIEITIPDLVVNGTVLKRKAKCFDMQFNQANKFVSVSWVVRYYAKNGNAFGASLNSFFPDYTITSVATNNTLVNPSTGEILTNPTGNVMGQYDWFFMISKTQPLIVSDMIEQYGSQITNWNKQ